MNKSEKINSFSVAMLLPSLSKAPFFGLGFSLIFLHGKTSVIYTSIIGFLLGFLILFLITKVMDILPNLSLKDKINKLFKKPIALLLNLFFFISSLFVAILTFYRTINFLSTQYLTDTPTIILSILIILVIFYLLTKNIEVITRFATIITFITFTLVILNIFGLISFLDLNNLKPLEFEKLNFIKASLIFTGLFAAPLYLLTLIPKNNIKDKEKLNKYLFSIYSITGIFLILIIFFIIGCLGIEIIDIVEYPAYMVLKKIKILDFIESIENIIFILWFLYLLIICSFSLLYCKNYLLGFVKKKKKNKNIIFSLILSFITLLTPFLLFEGKYNLTKKIYDLVPYIMPASIVLVLLIIYIKSKFKKNIN